MSEQGRQRLSSWKEIAAYVRREVRTVVRWEKERGLPVHRVPGGQGRSVFAFTDELDRWAAGELSKDAPAPPKPAPRIRPWAAVASGMAIVGTIGAIAAGLARAWPHREIADVKVRERSIEALDRDGNPRWTFDSGADHYPINGRVSQVLDLTGDSHPEGIVTVAAAPRPHEPSAGLLYAFDEHGDVLWRRSLDDRLMYTGSDFDPPWQPDDVMTFTNGGEPFIAWSVHHLTWWPSMLAVFDAKGSRIGTFASAGWIRSSYPSVDGRHIITAGFSNSRNGAAFAVLDARNPSGATPEEAGSPYECRNCPTGRPLRYFVIEWSDVTSALPPDDRQAVASIHPGTGTIELRAKQRANAELIVELSPSFELRKRWTSDAFWEWHQRLEQNGTLTHQRDVCPYRDGPIVREWTPAAGWKVHRSRDIQHSNFSKTPAG